MMEQTGSSRPTSSLRSNGWRTLAPIVTLIFLAPVLTEVLMGVVHITNIWLLVPEMGVYGLAALLIREAARWQQRGWGTILLLGTAYALAEECVILQTSLTPQFFSPLGTPGFGWAFGVQWFYLLAMLVYESVYAIVLPIALTEILFPARRAVPWLDRRGIVVVSIIFLASSVGVWWLWSHNGIRKYGPSAYQVPPLYIGLALLIIVMIIIATLGFRSYIHIHTKERTFQRHAWNPWLLGPIAFIFGFFWWILVLLAYIPASTFHNASPLIPLGIGLVWALLALVTIRFLVAVNGWQDRHSLALIFGATLASMIGGSVSIITASPLDKIGKLVFDLIAIVLLSILAWRLRKRRQISPEQVHDSSRAWGSAPPR